MPAQLTTVQPPADSLMRDNVPLILIVDDDRDIRCLLSSILSEDYPAIRVLGAATSQQALEIAAHIRPDLLLLDLWGSDMNGIELYDALHTRCSEKIPTIMMSADAPQGDLDSRRIPLVVKPFNLERLLERVADILTNALIY